MGNRSTSLFLAVLAGLALPAAGRATGGVQPTGGTYAGAPPTVAVVACRASCSGLDSATRGSTVRISGSDLAGATGVVFLGGRGTRDDVTAAVAAATATSVEAVVPARARTGRVRVLGGGGQPSIPSRRTLRVTRAVAAGSPRIEARVESRRVFVAGARKATLSFFVGGDSPARVSVDLVHDGDPAPIASWTPAPAAPGAVQTVQWDGRTATGTPAEGRYEFRVASVGDATAMASQTASTATSAFVLLSHAFPIQGRHRIGMSPSQRFGAIRSGHTHQGQDVFADCGTPLVAVRGGRVKFRATQSAAGNYVILAGDDGVDYGYMHLRDSALVKKGDTVATGQPIGYVGDTGDADGCHLHFEEWSAPGWYTGGQPYDPLPDLQAWDV